jgi:hypothetical protein
MRVTKTRRRAVIHARYLDQDGCDCIETDTGGSAKNMRILWRQLGPATIEISSYASGVPGHEDDTEDLVGATYICYGILLQSTIIEGQNLRYYFPYVRSF